MLWCDRFSPSSPSELAVHPKKLLLAQAWLNDALKGANHIRKYRRVLILAGPTGAGKSTIIRTFSQQPSEQTSTLPSSDLLSSSRSKKKSQPTSKLTSNIERIGYDILEWKNSGHESSSSKPQEFSLWLMRAGVGSILSFEDCNPTPPYSPTSAASSSKNPAQIPDPNGPTVLLVDDLPNLYHGETLSYFCNALRQHLNTPRFSTPPLVVIISDTTVKPGENGLEESLLGTSQSRFRSNSEDRAINAHSLLPIDILNHPACCLIKLNAVNDTLIKKTLIQIVHHTNAFQGTFQKPSLKDLELITQASGGDIRAALNNLQLLSQGTSVLHHDRHTVKKSAFSSKKLRASSSNTAIQPFFAGRDESLVIFHSLGKILFNKRWGDDVAEDTKDKRIRGPKPDRLPAFWKVYDRRPTKTDLDRLYSGLRVPVDPFIAYLHHNYSSFTHEVEEGSFLLEYLSLADSHLSMRDIGRYNQASISDFYQFHVSARAITLGLPSPVIRKSQKFFKPVLWDRLRQLNENLHLCDSFRHQLNSPVGPDQLTERDRHGYSSGFRSSIEDCLSVIHYSSTSLAVEVLPFLSLISKYRRAEDRKPASSDELVERLSKFNYPHQNKRVRGNDDEQLLSEDETWDHPPMPDPEEFGDDEDDQNDRSRVDLTIDPHPSSRPPLQSLQENLPTVHHLDDAKLWFEDEDDIVDSDS